MEIDEAKKRKIEEEEVKEEVENINLEETLNAYVESSRQLAKLVHILAHKMVKHENIFSKDLFK